MREGYTFLPYGVAAHLLHDEHGGIIRGPGGNATTNSKPKSWYNAECREARANMKAAERIHGRASAAAQGCRAIYRRVSKAAKNAFFQKRSEEKFEQMLKDPRKFHKWFGGQQPGVRVGSVNEWT